MSHQARKPVVWMNVSTTAVWDRPAVGIVRVERALAAHLAQAIDWTDFRMCIWQDGAFVEWLPPETAATSPAISNAVDAFLPRGASFDLARPFVARALSRFKDTSSTSGVSTDGLRVKMSADVLPTLHPERGDFLISVGLDWDMPYAPLLFDMAQRRGLRIVTCCYDLIPVLFPQYCVGEVAKRFTEYFLDLTWGSEAVLCISEQTRRDYESLCQRIGAPTRRTVVIPLGDNIPQGSGVLSDQVLAVSKEPFILYVSTIERRKNHEVLYRAFHLLARKKRLPSLPKLVFVGMHGWGIGDLMKDIELDPLTRGRIVELNNVSDGELAHLYEKSMFCVYPSLYEGWGLPVGEALSVGKAVICSDQGSLPEAGGDLVKYVPAWDPYAWAEAIADYCEDPSLVAKAEQQVRARYRPRRWVDTAAIVASLLNRMSREAEAPIVLSAGYAMSTHTGIHVGPAIRSLGKQGLLMFGPHYAIGTGNHLASVRVRLDPGSVGTARFSVVSSRGETVHAAIDASVLAESIGECVVEIPFALRRPVEDMEIKCEVDAGCLVHIDQVSVRRRGTDPVLRISPFVGESMVAT